MNIAAAFVEIVVVGAQAFVWLSLLSVSLFGDSILRSAKGVVKDLHSSLVTVLALAVVYTLGVTVDRIGDGLAVLLKPRQTLLRIGPFRKWAEEAHGDRRLPVYLSEGKASSILEYIRSRIRIMRSTFFNLSMTVLPSLLLIYTHCDGVTPSKRVLRLAFTLLIGTVTLTVVFVCWGMLEITYDRRLDQANHALEERDGKPVEGGPGPAAGDMRS